MSFRLMSFAGVKKAAVSLELSTSSENMIIEPWTGASVTKSPATLAGRRREQQQEPEPEPGLIVLHPMLGRRD